MGPSARGSSRPCEATATRTRGPGQLVYHAGMQTLALFARESWWTPWSLAPERESSGTAAQTHGN